MPDYANPQDLNRYSYVRGNPVRFTDPSGHYTFEDDPDDMAFISPNRNPFDEPIRQNSDGCFDDGACNGNNLLPMLPTASASVVQNHGTDTPLSENLGQVAYEMDYLDASATVGLAAIAAASTVATVNPLPEVAADALKSSTLLADAIGLAAIIAADGMSGRTNVETNNNQLTVYIGTDTLASLISLGAGGLNPDVNTSALIDVSQVVWDRSRMNGWLPDSIRIDIYFTE